VCAPRYRLALQPYLPLPGKRVTALELIAIAQAQGFDAPAALRKIGKLPEA
jgi:hypothetical protein